MKGRVGELDHLGAIDPGPLQIISISSLPSIPYQNQWKPTGIKSEIEPNFSKEKMTIYTIKLQKTPK